VGLLGRFTQQPEGFVGEGVGTFGRYLSPEHLDNVELEHLRQLARLSLGELHGHLPSIRAVSTPRRRRR
jgi:hypothetical protein